MTESKECRRKRYLSHGKTKTSSPKECLNFLSSGAKEMLSRINNIRFSFPDILHTLSHLTLTKKPFRMGAPSPILQMKKLNLKELQWRTHVCTISKWRSSESLPQALRTVLPSAVHGSFRVTEQTFVTQCSKKVRRSREKGTGVCSLSSGSLRGILKSV